ncbi:LysR family transcriptional regulator [Cupriavidus sp. USMAA2-4]|uniref:LysR family transcriptional regulator n=1 Tax=Cupriavidus malaysiensis TaxID=367825 RepID=A0ABN4TY29_9BURK|nr:MULTISPECIES: LysR family transcriptional regulator [Cupriavidus]AOY94519.1 LysR family transcriptional regulator [Cupriavidus sp. USMAA2-4]AOZ02620.1 LysR family transcriptional regulator [Cupriavidus sp. USMAHM13]AOZ10015.1 LysR family transcriptional regulator [Cupriavidus malaysiensis]
MDRLEQYRVFVRVAEMGSFIKAAHALELPRASVSAAVQQLETGVGTRLLHRTTRQVRPTADGLQLLERVRPLLAQADEVEQLFRAGQRKAVGRLVVDVPSRIARRLVAPALPALLRRHPRLELVLGSTDRMVDLVQEGVDCAVRVGALQDSSLVVRPVGRLALINCASPGYLGEYGTPRAPEDLARGHVAVGYANALTGRTLPWEYRHQDETVTVSMPSRVVANNAETYIACCLAGIGLIQIPRFDVQDLLDRGELVEVLPQHRAAPMPLSLVYPHRRQRSARLNAFFEWFEALIAPSVEP